MAKTNNVAFIWIVARVLWEKSEDFCRKFPPQLLGSEE